jgi:ferric-dicitrate binding protein FerR (iron transport regulator)
MPGNSSVITGQTAPTTPDSVSADCLAGWLSGRLVSEHTPLSEVVAELERTYDVSIVPSEPELNDLTLTSTCEVSDEIDTVLSSLCLTLEGYEYEAGTML